MERRMQVLATRPCGSATLVDIEITPGVRLYNLKLSVGGDGNPRLHAPNAFGSRTAGFDKSIIQAVAAAVQGEPLANDRS